MKAGFAQINITPPVGIELCGFGPFLRRMSNGVYEPLYAKAFAVEAGRYEAIIIACDLIGLTKELVNEVRYYTSEITGVPVEAIMVCCTHTHSGPVTIDFIGWGEPDQRYIARLPARISEAAYQAHKNLDKATISTISTMSAAEVDVEGLSYNREYGNREGDPGRPLDEKAIIFRFNSGDKLLGFVSYFSVHPVVCCEETHKIHSDFVGIASNLVANENEQAVGLFLQGACGDINSIYCHKPEDISLKNLEELSKKYAQILRRGLKDARPVRIDSIKAISRSVDLEQVLPDKDELKQNIKDAKRILYKKSLSELDEQNAAFTLYSCKAVLQKLERGIAPVMAIELQAIKIGDFILIANPFELFNTIKKEVEWNCRENQVLVVGYANDYKGYAPTEDRYELDGKQGYELNYAAYYAPFMLGNYCFKPVLSATLVKEMTALCKKIAE